MPLATGECRARAAATKALNKRSPCSGGAAVEKPGRSPWRVSAAKVNCGTSSSSPSDLLQTEVHLAGFVGENAVFEQFVEEPGARGLVILGTDAHEHEEPRSDGGSDFAADFHPRSGDAL